MFVFKAIKVGRATLKINYTKTGSKAAAKVFATTVVVAPKDG